MGDFLCNSRIYFITTLTFGAVTTYTVFQKYGLSLALKGSYGIIGIMLAASIYYTTSTRETKDERQEFSSVISGIMGVKISISIFSMGLVLMIVSFSYIWVWLTIFGICIPMIANFRKNDHSTTILFQVMLIFCTAILGPLLKSEVYFGFKDLMKHTAFTRQLIQSSHTAGIQSLYKSYPGEHLLVASIHYITGVAPRILFPFIGLFCFLLLIIVYYKFYQYEFPPWFAPFGIASLSSIFLFQFFSSYFFPQSFAFVLISVVLLEYARKRNQEAINQRDSIITYLLLSTLIVSHHLTVFLFIPIFIFIIGNDITNNQNNIKHGLLLSTIILVSAFNYWTSVDKDFLSILLIWVVSQFNAGVDRTSVALTHFGRDPSELMMSIGWLVGPFGLYFVILVACFILGISVIIFDLNKREIPLHYLILGVSGSIFIFKIPIPLKSKQRIGLMVLPFFSIIIGVSFFYLSRSRFRWNLSMVGWASKIFLSTMIVLFVATSGIVWPNDVYGLEPERNTETYLEQDNFDKIRSVAKYTETSNAPTYAFPAAGEYTDLDKKNPTSIPWLINGGLKIEHGILIYRTAWAEKVININRDGIFASSFTVSNQWLQSSTSSSNKVYDSGGLGVLWCQNNCVISPPQNESTRKKKII